jgi:cell wall-associated NlpC family hydrolase
MEQHYGVCRVAVAPLRPEQSDKAEIASQLLFGDHVEILEKTDRWLYVRNAYDGYEGWMDFKQLSSLSAGQYLAHHSYDTMVPAQPLNIITAADGSNYYLSPTSKLPAYKDGFCYLGEEKFQVSFTPHHPKSSPSAAEIIAAALFFKNVPYQWGGRTLFGIDCSGFVQTVFKLNGIKLKRDAWQQAEQGTTVDFLPEAKAGDVAFFDNAEGRIVHVGLMLSANEIIHASGKVKIDPLDNEGIYSAELGRYTHKLRIIKRFI